MFIPLATMPRLILFCYQKEESDFFRELPQKIESRFQISKNVLNESFGFISRGIKVRTKTREVLELIQKFELQAKQSLRC